MRQPRTLAQSRRIALKELVVSAHYIASAWALSDDAVAQELRRLADLMDALATRGTEAAISCFFQAPSEASHGTTC